MLGRPLTPPPLPPNNTSNISICLGVSFQPKEEGKILLLKTLYALVIGNEIKLGLRYKPLLYWLVFEGRRKKGKKGPQVSPSQDLEVHNRNWGRGSQDLTLPIPWYILSGHWGRKGIFNSIVTDKKPMVLINNSSPRTCEKPQQNTFKINK